MSTINYTCYCLLLYLLPYIISAEFNNIYKVNILFETLK